jgi:hypothetical protein
VGGNASAITRTNITEIPFNDLHNLNSSQQRVLLATLTALSIIPFAISAILIAAWGKQPFWHKYAIDRDAGQYGRQNPYKIQS